MLTKSFFCSCSEILAISCFRIINSKASFNLKKTTHSMNAVFLLITVSMIHVHYLLFSVAFVCGGLHMAGNCWVTFLMAEPTVFLLLRSITNPFVIKVFLWWRRSLTVSLPICSSLCFTLETFSMFMLYFSVYSNKARPWWTG